MKEEIKILEEYLEEARDENSFTDCEGLFEDKFFISLDKLLKRYKELEEVVNKYGGEQELEKYITELSRFLGNVSIDAMLCTIKMEFIPISVIQNKLDYYDKEIKKLENKKIWNEPCDTIIRNRFCNYYNALKLLLEERSK